MTTKTTQQQSLGQMWESFLQTLGLRRAGDGTAAKPPGELSTMFDQMVKDQRKALRRNVLDGPASYTPGDIGVRDF